MKKGFLSFITVAALTIGITGNASAEEVKVQDGDTLWDIAEQKEVSVEELKEWNDLSGEIIHPDDILKIQEYYDIIKGDTLWDIAIENDISVNDLKEWNGIISHIIYPGDELIIDHKDNKEENSTKAVTNQKETKKVETVSEKPAEPAVEKETEKAETVSEKPAEPAVEKETKKTETVSAEPTEPAVEKETKKAETVSAEPTEPAVEKEITVEATAYTANCEGCSGTTKTGIDLKANPDKKVIAVDPDVIPLGTKVHVEGYGEAIAGDIGGGIKNNEIDVFIPSESQAIKWGRKEVQVKILD